MKNKKMIGTTLILLVILAICMATLVVILVVNNNISNSTWTQVGNKITKGKTELYIGDYYEYDESAGGLVTEIVDVDWKVLGVSSTGELLIMSSKDIANVSLGEKDNLEVCKKDYLDGIKKLNDLCAPYGRGKGAISARCITIEDINKITGFDKTQYGKGQIYEYANDVTYYWDVTQKPAFIATNGANGNLSHVHENFVWYNKETGLWETIKISDVATKDSPENIVTIKNTFYSYSATDLKATNPKAYSMLFENEDGTNAGYWLSSSFVYTSPQFVGYGFHKTVKDDINYMYLVYSPGYAGSFTTGVRAVVSII